MNIELFENLRVDAALAYWREVTDSGRSEPALNSPEAEHFLCMCKVLTQKELCYLLARWRGSR